MAGVTSSSPGLRIARPTIFVGGKEEATLSQGLLRLSVEENTLGLYRGEACFGNLGPKDNQTGFLYFDRKKLDFGKAFQVKLDADTIFEGAITGLEADFGEGAPPQISVLAEDALQDLRMTRRTRTFTEVSDADVIKTVASAYGLQSKVDASGPKYKVLTQVNQSDLAFIRDRARAIDAEIWLDGKNLNVKSRGKRDGGSVEMTLGGELLSFRALADLSGQRTSVKVTGWDVGAKSALEYEAKDAAVSSELNGDSSGASILQSAFGERKECIAHRAPLSRQEAQSAAEAYFRMSARRFVAARGVAQGNAKLRVGSYLKVKGVGPLFEGKYYLSEVRHCFDNADGFRTEFTAERPGIGKAA